MSKNDKEGRKKLQLEIKKLEDDLKARHENEIKAFEARQKEQESQVNILSTSNASIITVSHKF